MSEASLQGARIPLGVSNWPPVLEILPYPGRSSHVIQRGLKCQEIREKCCCWRYIGLWHKRVKWRDSRGNSLSFHRRHWKFLQIFELRLVLYIGKILPNSSCRYTGNRSSFTATDLLVRVSVLTDRFSQGDRQITPLMLFGIFLELLS